MTEQELAEVERIVSIIEAKIAANKPVITFLRRLGPVTLGLILLAAIAFGVNWMGYEQMRANSGFFIAPPTAQELHPNSF